MLKNIKISIKVLSLSILLLACVLIVGIIGYYFNMVSNRDMAYMFNNSLKRVEILNDSRAQARANEANLLFLFQYNANEDKRTQYIGKINEGLKNIDDTLLKFKSMGNLDKFEQEQLDTIDTNQKVFRKVSEEAIGLSKEGKALEAFGLVAANVKYFEQYQQAILDITNYNIKQAENLKLTNEKGYINSQRIFIFVLIVSVIIGILLSYAIIHSITKPLRLLTKHLDVVSTGNLTIPLEDKLLKAKDELGNIARAVNTVQVSIRDIIKSVMEETDKVNSSVITSNSDISKLTDELVFASETIQLLSSGIEETASSVQEIEANSNEIESTIELIAKKAQDGALSANEISNKANILKSKAITSQSNVNDIRLTIDNKLKEALLKSKEVEKIKALSDAITQISSKTNLLALNASIESARAGEAGRGFSVVADQIRNLSEESKQTADQIQSTIKIVFEAVTGLAEASQQTLEFIDTEVLEGYREMVQTGENYDKDSLFIEALVKDLSNASEELLVLIKNVSEGINEISRVSNEGSVGTSSISLKVSNITENAHDIKNQANSIKYSSDKLKDIVAQFII